MNKATNKSLMTTSFASYVFGLFVLTRTFLSSLVVDMGVKRAKLKLGVILGGETGNMKAEFGTPKRSVEYQSGALGHRSEHRTSKRSKNSLSNHFKPSQNRENNKTMLYSIQKTTGFHAEPIHTGL